MATTGQGQNKSAFLRELFPKNPALTLEGATEAWQKAGNEGEVSSSLYYNIKRAATGGAGGGGAAPSKPKPKASKGSKSKPVSQAVGEARTESNGNATRTAVRESASGDRERVLDRVEDRIDDLIGELKQLGGLDDALEALRKARRVVVRSHEG